MYNRKGWSIKRFFSPSFSWERKKKRREKCHHPPHERNAFKSTQSIVQNNSRNVNFRRRERERRHYTLFYKQGTAHTNGSKRAPPAEVKKAEQLGRRCVCQERRAFFFLPPLLFDSAWHPHVWLVDSFKRALAGLPELGCAAAAAAAALPAWNGNGHRSLSLSVTLLTASAAAGPSVFPFSRSHYFLSYVTTWVRVSTLLHLRPSQR